MSKISFSLEGTAEVDICLGDKRGGLLVKLAFNPQTLHMDVYVKQCKFIQGENLTPQQLQKRLLPLLSDINCPLNFIFA